MSHTERHPSLDLDLPLLSKVSEYVKVYMQHYDGSHDYSHIHRVVGLAHSIAMTEPAGTYDLNTVLLAALLHDVGDRKYLRPGEDGTTMIANVLVEMGVGKALANKVQTITNMVSYSTEIKDPQKVLDTIKMYPELAVVQDADRLDAIGAVGVGRAFTFGGAHGGKVGSVAKSRSMQDTIGHFTEKLELLGGMMKTAEGRKLAAVRTKRLKEFRVWWEEEQTPAMLDLGFDH